MKTPATYQAWPRRSTPIRRFSGFPQRDGQKFPCENRYYKNSRQHRGVRFSATALERSGKRQGRHAAGVIQRVQWDAYHSARRATRFAGETVGVADNDYGLADDDRGFAHGVNGLSRRAKRLTRCSIGVFLSFFDAENIKTLINIRFTITRCCSVEKKLK